MRQIVGILVALILIFGFVPVLSGQEIVASEKAANTGVAVTFIEYLKGILKAIQSGDMWGILIAICNLLVALLKNEWVQAKIKLWGDKKTPWLSKRMKVSLALVIGILLVYFIAPANSVFRTVLKGLNVGLCSIGVYSIYKHFKPQVEEKLPEEESVEETHQDEPETEDDDSDA